MAAKRCGTCNINYPADHAVTCEGCGEKTDSFSNVKPHEDWTERVAEVQERQAEAARLAPQILEFDIPIEERNGQLFISSWDVCRAGFQTQLVPDTLVRVGKKPYEVGGYSETRREYWLLPATSEETDGSTGNDLHLRHLPTLRKRAERSRRRDQGGLGGSAT